MNWTEFYLGLAYTVAQKSKDTTKHGCVITDRNHRVLGIGYNGFLPGYPDEEIPTTRDKVRMAGVFTDKYDWTLHAEENAISNCAHMPENGIAYVSGRACVPCLKKLYSNGIRLLIMMDRMSAMLSDNDIRLFDKIVEKSKRSSRGEIITHYVKPDLSWLQNLDEQVKKLIEQGCASGV